MSNTAPSTVEGRLLDDTASIAIRTEENIRHLATKDELMRQENRFLKYIVGLILAVLLAFGYAYWGITNLVINTTSHIQSLSLETSK